MTGNSSEESKMANQLFNSGISKRADELIEKAGVNISRGAIDQAHEDLRRAFPLVQHSILNPEQGLLSDDEYSDLVRLTNKYITFEGGFQVYNHLEDWEKKKLDFLKSKSKGLVK